MPPRLVEDAVPPALGLREEGHDGVNRNEGPRAVVEGRPAAPGLDMVPPPPPEELNELGRSDRCRL